MAMTAPRPHPLFNALTHGSQFRQYKLLEQIGVGGEGVVWSAVHQVENRIYAVKFNEVPESDEGEADDMRDELQLAKLVGLRHGNILPVLEYGFERQMRFTVSPYIPGGTLTQKIKASPFTLEEIMRCGTEVAAALDYLHAQGIIHRDLKSANVLLDLNQNCYLADFGLARLVSTSTLAFHTGHGTPPYSPPEQIQMKAITPKSDVYSFGILLYEMFTGQLPWNGKKQLSMEQLSSKQELPDPREFNEYLPSVLTDILRRTTSADPALRPPSAGEIMKALGRVLNIPVGSSSSRSNGGNGWVVRDEDTANLLKRALAQWKATDETYNLGLTKFALVDLEREKINMDTYSHFMLSQALTYGYNDDEWWQAVRDPRERLAISSRLLRKHNETIVGRIVGHLTSDPDIQVIPTGLPDGTTGSLLEIGINSDNPFLRREIFEGVRKLTQARSAWGNSSRETDTLRRLGGFALEDSEFGDTAAELIGHLRSASAVRVVLEHPDEERKIAALLLIQKAAGSLPAFVQGQVRFRLSSEWIIQRLIQEPVSLIGAYALAFLGAALGVGIQVYLTYNLPDFLDTVRIITSLEQGLIIGLISGLGIFMTRVIVERFPASVTLARLAVGTVVGGIGLNIALLIFHILFLSTPPSGFLITAASGLVALSFAIGGLLRSRLLRMMLSTMAVFVAIIGTWWIHIRYSASTVDLTPVFRYDYAWTLPHISLVALGIALLIGIFGNLGNLSITEK